jgi:hypothetical protein
LLTLSWSLTALSVFVALAALVRARRTSRRLERLAESYWELRYESGQLKARVARLEAAVGPMGTAAEPEAVAPRAASPASFIPLSSLKK